VLFNNERLASPSSSQLASTHSFRARDHACTRTHCYMPPCPSSRTIQLPGGRAIPSEQAGGSEAEAPRLCTPSCKLANSRAPLWNRQARSGGSYARRFVRILGSQPRVTAIPFPVLCVPPPTTHTHHLTSSKAAASSCQAKACPCDGTWSIRGIDDSCISALISAPPLPFALTRGVTAALHVTV